MTMDALLTRKVDLRSIFAPESIAVIGASADPARHNGRPIANLQRAGFAGRIYPVTAREGEVNGLASYRRIGDVPERVDLVYVMVRAELAAGVVEECVAARARTVVVCSSGFAEEGAAGAAAQQSVRDLVAASETRVIGPNCIGTVGVQARALSCTTLNITDELLPGALAIVSQSGGMAVNLYNRAVGRGIGVRGLVSLGNEADADLADVLLALADDPGTSAAVVYVEQLRDLPRFREAMDRCRTTGTHVVAVKAGRSAAGARSAQGHTGAMAGAYDVFRDLVGDLGVIVVDDIDDALDTARALVEWGTLAGDRLLVVSPSGGECGYVADLAADAGLDVAELPREVADRLAAIMRFGSPANPLDLTGQVIGDSGILDRVFAEIGASQAYDAVLIALPTWGAFDSARLVPPMIAAARHSPVPLAITAWSSRGLTEFRDGLMRESGVLEFDNPRRAVRALARLAAPAPTAIPARRAEDGVGSRSIPAHAFLDEAAAKMVLAEAGLPVSEEVVVTGHDEAAVAAERLGGAVVLKGIAPGVVHKSDLGLVRTDVSSPAALIAGLEAIDAAAARHDVALSGYLVARRYTGVELIVGCIRDDTFGMVMLIGAGGVLAELLDDRTFLACPAEPADVRRAVSRLRMGRVLQGYRGQEVDLDAVCEALAAFSRFAASANDLLAADLNPVIVGAHGAVIVDAVLEPLTVPGKDL